MSLRGFLFIVALTDALAWGAWGMLLTTTNPESGLALIGLFYASLLLALIGLFVVFGFAVHVYVFKRDEVIHTFVKRTFRQSFLLALLLIISLWLGHNEWLRWWVLLLVVGVLGAWEHFFLTGEESY
ncbi:MAG: hypothetical protein QG607_255 [Patescibacteria group bacterium]|jgi:hypothetical protein|nr:hypothetical protein [Patescibacteria group bacterium]